MNKDEYIKSMRALEKMQKYSEAITKNPYYQMV